MWIKNALPSSDTWALVYPLPGRGQVRNGMCRANERERRVGHPASHAWMAFNKCPSRNRDAGTLLLKTTVAWYSHASSYCGSSCPRSSNFSSGNPPVLGFPCLLRHVTRRRRQRHFRNGGLSPVLPIHTCFAPVLDFCSLVGCKDSWFWTPVGPYIIGNGLTYRKPWTWSKIKYKNSFLIHLSALWNVWVARMSTPSEHIMS